MAKDQIRYGTIICGNCHKRHHTAATVRLCHAGVTFPCEWGEKAYSEDGPYTRLCGAAAWETERGWECDRGHEHVTVQVRRAEGWDYAETEWDRRSLAAAGIQAVEMDGSAWAGGLRR